MIDTVGFPILDYKIENDKAFLADLVFSNPGLSTRKILQFYGLSKAKEIIDILELRGMLSKQNQKDWSIDG